MYGHKKKGSRMSGKKSRSVFSRHAQWIHPLNVHNASMRGGFRI